MITCMNRLYVEEITNLLNDILHKYDMFSLEERILIEDFLQKIELLRNIDATQIALRHSSYLGKNIHGIEVFRTSEETKNLSYKERTAHFMDLTKNQCKEDTVQLIRNGHAYCAQFEGVDIRKNIYGDKRSDKKGKMAKINMGADGCICDLLMNAQYNGSRPESGKKISAHKDVMYWDYFIKDVQIDNRVYHLVANIRKTRTGNYVYSIQMNVNKEIEVAPSLDLFKLVLNRMLTTSIHDSISRNEIPVNILQYILHLNEICRSVGNFYNLIEYKIF